MTERLQFPTTPPYTVTVGAGALDGLPAIVAGAAVAVVTDRHVEALHVARLGPLATAPRHVLAPGEGSKSLSGLERLLDFLVAQDLDRASVVVAFGGGVVGDLAGLAASLFMRGVRVVQCPTTLLSQVDSAIGGKTAVNLTGGKNLAGTFHQPAAVLADPELLATLPDREFASGLGEVVKSALVGDAELLALLERDAARVVAREPAILSDVILRCCRVKASVVGRDEREAGERKKLNLGHTFGHAIERVAGYGAIPHGVAVATGLTLAVEASAAAGVLADRSLRERIPRLLAALGLAPDLATLRGSSGAALAPEELVAAMRHDKKGSAGEPAFVLVRSPGDLALDVSLEVAVLSDLLS